MATANSTTGPLQSSELEELTTKLKKDVPTSLPILAAVQNIISGKLDGEIYTSGWPSFSAVICRYSGTVCQWFFICHASSSEDLLALLGDTKLVKPGQTWVMLVEAVHADFLFNKLKAKGGSIFSMYHIPHQHLKDSSMTLQHPDGFSLRRLEECHAELIAPVWPYSDDSSAKEKFFKSLIKIYHSVGMFNDEEPDMPIAWCVQYPYGHPGHLYVAEKYRRRGFASLLLEHMCSCIVKDGLEPQIAVSINNDSAKNMMEKLGFVEHGKFMYMRA